MVEILKLIGHLGYDTFGIFLCENAHKLILNILILIPTQKNPKKTKQPKTFVLFPVVTFKNVPLCSMLCDPISHERSSIH